MENHNINLKSFCLTKNSFTSLYEWFRQTRTSWKAGSSNMKDPIAFLVFYNWSNIILIRDIYFNKIFFYSVLCLEYLSFVGSILRKIPLEISLFVNEFLDLKASLIFGWIIGIFEDNGDVAIPREVLFGYDLNILIAIALCPSLGWIDGQNWLNMKC